MLDPNRLAADRIGPAGDIASGEDSRRARLEIGVDNDAPIHSEACRFGQPDTRAHAETRDDEIGLDRGSIRQTDLPSLDPDRSRAEMEADAMLLVQRANELPHVMAEDALHRNVSGAATWTSMSRALSAAATSSPMKLAPSTRTVFAVLARSIIARQSASVRRTNISDDDVPGIDARTGSAPVARRSLSNGTLSPPASATSREATSSRSTVA